MKRYIKSSRFSNLSPVMAGTRYDKQAAKILYEGGIGSDLSAAEHIIDLLFHTDLHAFAHAPNWLEKYLKGIARIIVEESGGNWSKASSFIAKSIPTFNTYLSYVKKLRDKLGGTKYDNHFINEMSFADVEKSIEDLEDEYYDDLDIDNSNVGGYSLIPIETYEELHSQFGGHWTGDGKSDGYAGDGHGGTAWCHANNKPTYERYTNHGNNKFFILAVNDWKDIKFDSKSNSSNPKDSYGNSLIALVVNKKTGKLINSTLRCNHVGHPSGDADNQYNYSQLSTLAGFDVKATIKEQLGIVTEHEFIYKNSKYGMIANDKIEYEGHTLYRIQALKNFGKVEEDEIGGYVESLENLSETDNCWIIGSGKVFDNARISENAIVCETAVVYGNANIHGTATIYGCSKVYGDVEIYGYVKVSGFSMIYGNAKVSGGTTIFDNVKIFGDAIISGSPSIRNNSRIGGAVLVDGYNSIANNALILGNAHITDNAKICENARIDDDAVAGDWSVIRGNSFVGGNATILGEAEIFGKAQIYGHATVYDKAQVYDSAKVCGQAEVYETAEVYGSAKVYKDAKVHGTAEVCGYAKVNYETAYGLTEH